MSGKQILFFLNPDSDFALEATTKVKNAIKKVFDEWEKQ
jgi:hypothetical protein